MKRLYTLLIAITAISPAITATAATAADTVIDATTVNRVIIAESNHAATITLDGIGSHADSTFTHRIRLPWNGTEHYSAPSTFSVPLDGDADCNDRLNRWHISTGGVAFGWVNAPGTPAEMGKSLEIGWFEILGVSYSISRMSTVSVGAGINWRNYKTSLPDVEWQADEAGNATFATWHDTETTSGVSRLKTFSVTIPVMFKQKMPFKLCGQRQWIAAGAELCLTPHASLLSTWHDSEGAKHKLGTDNINHRLFTCNVVGMLGLSDDIGLYVRYCPMRPLAAPSPDFRPLSTGIILFY